MRAGGEVKNAQRVKKTALHSGTVVDNRFDQARSQIYAQLEALRAEMQGCHREFLEATGGYVEHWYHAQIRRILRENPGRFAALPEVSRTEFKREVLNLVDDTPRTIRRFFNNEDIWWDLKDPSAPRRHYDYSMDGNLLPPAIDEPLRFTMGALLPIVERYRFSAAGFSIRQISKGFDDRAPRYPFYRQRYECTPQMITVLQGYANLHTKAVAAEKNLSEVDRAEAREQDELLWEQA